MDIDDLMNIIKKLGPVDTILIGGSLLSLFILLSSKHYELLAFFELLFNLEWYWYVAFLIIAAIRPVMHLMRMRSNKTQKKEVKKNID